jgi:uncharacterized membrane protein
MVAPLPASRPASAAAARAAALASLLGLIALGIAWELWLAPTGQRTLAVKVVPLVLPLPGLVHDRLRTFRWTSLLVWLYFIEGAVRAAGDRGPGATLALLEIALCLALFAACLLRVRAERAASTVAPQPPAP